MGEKSRRRLLLEQSLEADPEDLFLRYGLAMQCLTEGDVAEGRERLRSLITDHPDSQIAAYQQLGQSLADSGELAEARLVLAEGVRRALAAGDGHAAAEMNGFLSSLA